MADPNPYVVSYNFGGFQASNPTTPLPGSALDGELANAAAATAVLVAAIKDVRRSDGALNNGIVTFDSLHSSVQMTIDPTNGVLVAAAVATAQAAAVSAAAFDTSAGVHEVAAEAAAVAAAASAATVNLSLYLAKANNLAGLGSNDTALSNIGAAKADGTTLTGRLAPNAAYTVTDWNTVATNGWFAGYAASNAPLSSTPYWLVQCIAHSDDKYVTQIAYPFVLSSSGTAAVTPYRRHSYDLAGVRTWTSWESYSPVAVGSVMFFPATAAPSGWLKVNGALLSRATYPALYA
ncbi:MAG: tail fiber protein, partial [Bradyrhizobium sp.]